MVDWAAGRQWIVAVEQGKPTLKVFKVVRTSEALGFQVVVATYNSPPSMPRAVDAAEEKKKALAARGASAFTRRA